MIFKIYISFFIYFEYTNLMKDALNSKEIIQKFHQAMLDQYEQNTPFQLYEEEQLIFSCIRNGDLEELEKRMEIMATTSPPIIGTMSKDPVKQTQFTVVSGITLATRAAMSGGLPDAEAYHLSDAYLQKLDNSITAEDALSIFVTALRDFTSRVNKAKITGTYSLPVTKALKYINTHLHEKTSLPKIAKYCSVTPQYLSTIFHKETGMTVSAYIRTEKLKVSAQMLETSSFSIQRISTILEFPSQSAYTTQFKAVFHMTPYQYRKDCICKI